RTRASRYRHARCGRWRSRHCAGSHVDNVRRCPPVATCRRRHRGPARPPLSRFRDAADCSAHHPLIERSRQLQGFGVHTSMWTMNWDRAGAERTIPAAAAYKMDFIEVALVNPGVVDAPHTRGLLDQYELRAVCSLGLPEHAWPSVDPDKGFEHLKVTMD